MTTGTSVEQPYFGSPEFGKLLNFLGGLGKQVIISEYSFPHSEGNFFPAPAGYSYSPSGQAQWLRDFLSILQANPYVKGSFYFYPEHFPGVNYTPMPELEASGLFQDAQHILPALEVFKEF